MSPYQMKHFQEFLDNKLKEIKMQEPNSLTVGKIEQLTETKTKDTLMGIEQMGANTPLSKQVTSDGLTAKYYELPPDAKELQDLIAFKNMNSQMGEIGRTWYRYGECSHSDMMREINKIIFYAEAEKDRLMKYGNKK